jgi:hypothetical protein
MTSQEEVQSMKRIIIFLVISCGIALPSAVMAQSSDSDHVEVGVFADYMNLSVTDPHINFVGVGGRAAFNVHPNVQLEGEMSYDFKRNFTSVFTNGVTSHFVQTSLRPLSALFGPKFQTSSGPFRAYVTGKVGFIKPKHARGFCGGCEQRADRKHEFRYVSRRWCRRFLGTDRIAP